MLIGNAANRSIFVHSWCYCNATHNRVSRQHKQQSVAAISLDYRTLWQYYITPIIVVQLARRYVNCQVTNNIFVGVAYRA